MTLLSVHLMTEYKAAWHCCRKKLDAFLSLARVPPSVSENSESEDGASFICRWAKNAEAEDWEEEEKFG